MRREFEHKHNTDNPDQIMRDPKGWLVDSSWPPSNYGLKATEESASVRLIIPGTVLSGDSTKDIQIKSMGITYMKAYSDQWKDSTLHVEICSAGNNSTVNNTNLPLVVLGSGDYSGIHERKTSECYTEVLSIIGHQAGEDLNATLQMTGDNTFKIIALTFCSTTSKTQRLKFYSQTLSFVIHTLLYYCCTQA